MRLVLASGSPRRKELLSLLDIPFEVIVSDFEESIDSSKPLDKEIERLSFGKAKAVFDLNNDAVVIGSDTIVTIDNKVLGKPKTEEKAIEMLKEIQGREHTVITGVTIMSKDKIVTFHTASEVYFNKMSEEEIIAYAKTKEPLDKAGAYAIQGIGSKFINKIDGDYYSIMGLPVSELYTELKNFID